MIEPAFELADALAAQLLPADMCKVLEQLGARMSDADATALALSPSAPRVPEGALA